MRESLKKEEKCLVSVIIPAYQAEAFIERSVRSALDQTYPKIEVIVVENGSTDRTMEVLGKIHDDRLHLLQSEKGVSNARNKGIKHCSGDFLLFLDADDWLERKAVESMMLVAEDDVDIISARYYGDKPFEKYDSCKYAAGTEEYIVKCLLKPTKRGNCTGNLYRTSFIRESKVLFEPDLSHAEDSVFFLGLLLHKPVVVDLEHPVYHVYYNPKSATRGKNNNTEEFCAAISKIYNMLEKQSRNIQNAGYIFALNQLLVILVNSRNSLSGQIRFMKEVFQKPEFSKAVREVNLDQAAGAMKHIFFLMKKQMYVLLAFAVNARAAMNARRSG